ncbi:MAG: FHA domain-containing protein [Prosthecobacter sp.]|nr:FHA domain-containing protein [Prosthecobacter sp.]
MATLVFYLEEGSSMSHVLEPGTTTVGRHPDSIIVLDCPSVSGHHAIIEMDERGCTLIDQQSSNGTRVNGVNVEEAVLKEGDRIGFGDIQAVFYAGDAPAEPAEETATPAVIYVPPPELPPKDEPPVAMPVDYRKIQRPPAKPRAVRVTGYPDTTESGCLTALLIMGLFFAAFITGLYMRHHQETEGGNLFSDLFSKISNQVPKIKIEK